VKRQGERRGIAREEERNWETNSIVDNPFYGDENSQGGHGGLNWCRGGEEVRVLMMFRET
jgi:hypothetical protein